MRFSLEVLLNIEGNSTYLRGEFTARRTSDIQQTGYQYIRTIKRETGYRTTIIEKVIVNRTDDITEQVQEIEKRSMTNKNIVF